MPEAYEPVEDGHITTSDVRDFTFADAVQLWGTQNPHFFEGTRAGELGLFGGPLQETFTDSSVAPLRGSDMDRKPLAGSRT